MQSDTQKITFPPEADLSKTEYFRYLNHKQHMHKYREEKFIKIKDIILRYMDNKGFSTNKIVVFGSFAKGIETRESDIDIIIVSKNLRDKNLFDKVSLMSDVHVELVKKCKRPFDIMYYSDEEWKNGFSYIIKIAKKEGEVIFE